MRTQDQRYDQIIEKLPTFIIEASIADTIIAYGH